MQPNHDPRPRAGNRIRSILVLLALVVAGTAIPGDAARAESNGGVRVLPLGDSITEGTQVPGGYRIGLWQRLAAAGYRTDFVGSQFNGPAALGDHDHEGHPGWRIDQVDAAITGWVTATRPRSVLLHLGTNDVLQNYNLASAPARLSTLIDHITAAAPEADVFVATIVPLASASQETAGRAFNATIPGIVRNKVNAGRHVHLVDMHAALNTADLIDGVHPTAGGYDKMAATWFAALRAVPGSIGEVGGGNLLANGTMENGTTDWAPFGGATLSSVTGTVHGGTRSLLATGRTASWNGPGQAVTAKLSNGRSYTTSVWARAQSGTATVKTTLAVTANGTTSYVRLTPDAPISAGGWTLLSGTATVSWAGALSAATLYVESTSGTTPFLIDDASLQ
ncbi:carbohydrate binding domain-containing protein [Actinoplanes sp. ATCC 53533]|uniref:carbohydrate binding domain-containing protein n=1 Tax=Actinoplanes sp. ATCC 53533 TaxID=1288362 RepID=UPI0026CF9CD0